MGSPVTLSHLTLSDPERLRCRILSKIDTCIVTCYVRVNPHFSWFSLQQRVFDASLHKIASVIPTAAVKQDAKVLGPLVERPQSETEWNLGLGGWAFSAYKVFLTLKWCRSFWSQPLHSDFQQACISKMAGRRAKRIEIWASGVSIQCTQGTFDT